MNPALSRIAGTRDYAEPDAAALRLLRDEIEQTFVRYTYVPVEPPILERTSPFLDRSGEDIRRRMYVFPDPSGREICLRPELTIPACRLFLREQGSGGQETRLSYLGPAFRYESPAEGRYRQFSQAGIELLGATNAEAADAEVIAVALDALRACGLSNLEVVLGDLKLITSFVDALPIPDRWKSRLVGSTRANVVLDIQSLSATRPSVESSQLLELLAAISIEKARTVVSEVLALADVRHVGGRSPEEIAERLVSRAAVDEITSISTEVVDGLSELLSIRQPIDEAFLAIRETARRLHVNLDSVLGDMEARLRILRGYGHDPTGFIFDAGLRRGLAYYTGFVFEVFAAGESRLGHLCGGGRYDDLLEALGASDPISAVGFALGLERVLIATGRSGGKAPTVNRPDALVVAAGNVAAEDCARVATALRAAGWSVETDLSGRRPRSALTSALRRGVPYIAFVGEEEMADRQVRLRRLGDHVEVLIPLAELESYARREGNRMYAGRKE